jgi:parallel beta-helix repeat protein
VVRGSGAVDLGRVPLAARPADGALRIVADGVTVTCSGLLDGAGPGQEPDGFHGVGILVTGKNVTLRGARVAGFKVGIHAVGADGLVLEDCDVSGNFRQRLRSTPAREAEEDWLAPHANDGHEWFARYGAGIYVERSAHVAVRRSRARAGQNGLVLERVSHAEVADNNFSFLSGWGIALWRSSDNVLARNACDFCVRGYSHGVYNRGQDSAGILLFEQCSRNRIVENSATHCGDGLFAFAGQEALGARPAPGAGFEHRGRGCNQNRIEGNDFSYAAAHGLELTFSFDNLVQGNRFVENAICGIWGGYSRRTCIRGNRFRGNGSAGYGLERGGVNIEHGQENAIEENRFADNACGVHLWWDEDASLFALPWTVANGHGVRGNRVRSNTFHGDRLAIQLRAAPDTILAANEYAAVGQAVDGEGVEARAEPAPACSSFPPPVPIESLAGPSPVGARAGLRGREHIRLDEWGPIEPAR